MNKVLNLVLEEEAVIELIRILLDDDSEAALAFSKRTSRAKLAN